MKKALDYSRKTRDKFAIGGALDWLALNTFWEAIAFEDSEESAQHCKTALNYAQEAKDQYHRIQFVSPRGGTLWIEQPHSEYYWQLARYPTDLRSKRELLEKALDAVRDQLGRAEKSGYPDAVSTAHHVFSKVLASLAKIETDSEDKRRLLEEAEEHRHESIRLADHLEPFHYWNRGVGCNYLSQIKSELANLAKDPDTKRRLLHEAVRQKEVSLQLWRKWMMSPLGQASHFALLGGWQYDYGDLLYSLHQYSNEIEDLTSAAKAFEQAAESFQKLDQVSRMAECYWRAARTYDMLDEHSKAAEKFILASKNYSLAGEKLPRLRDFYADHALYMEAWSELEMARYHHRRQVYDLARKYYERVASLHESTRRWRYLALNYSAWAKVEDGENSSRNEQCPEAIRAFEEASRLFREGMTSLQSQLGKVESLDEKQLVTRLLGAADLRREYCRGRIALEDAKIIDRKGDHYSSSERYGQAIEAFEKIVQRVDSEQTRQEFTLIITLSKAWRLMTKAAAEESPELYLEASRLFEAARELSPNEKARSLALGHSHFCKALEAGARFTDTWDLTLHASAVRHLQSAGSYYLKTGFQSASKYAEATELLLDAYLYVDQAKKENDQEKKARLYSMAERVLERSASSFHEAEQPAKREQVLRILGKVKRERELATELTEVLQAPSILSTTEAFSMPTPTQEGAVGLDRFEHADVQASVITRRKNLNVGEQLELEIEVVNAGKGPAQLVKVEGLIPQGFELTEKPQTWRAENGYLNMKGRRLDPLKTEEVKLVLKPKAKGTYTLRPRFLYLDESGKYKTHEPEPVEITVKELGISGWVKGR